MVLLVGINSLKSSLEKLQKMHKSVLAFKFEIPNIINDNYVIIMLLLWLIQSKSMRKYRIPYTKAIQIKWSKLKINF